MGDDALRDRVIGAALTCISRWGLAKTTLEDVAREAGCGRATIYRTFRGGKAEVVHAVLLAEVERLRGEVDASVAGATHLEDVLVGGVVAVARFLRGHDALAYLLAHEPEEILPWISFRGTGPLFDLAAGFADPHLAPFVPEPDERRRAAEWLTRVVLTYVLNPADEVDLTDEADTRSLLSTYVLPGITAPTQQELQ